MIESVTVINNRDEMLEMILAEPWHNGLQIESITGLGPGKGTINTQELATTDGAYFSSARVPARNIVITMALLENPDVETTRHLTYKYFPVKKEITLIFKTDHRTTAISGYVESNEPDIFQKKETAQISIICTDPYFYADNAKYILNGIQPLFQFPFSNESLTEPLLNFGEIVYQEGQALYYDGDIESGLNITLTITDHVAGFSLTNESTGITMSFDTSKVKQIVGGADDDFIEGDIVYISTVRTNKFVRLLRNGVQYNILTTLPKMTDWLTVESGDNVFSYSATTGVDDVSIVIESYVLYAGV